MRRVDSPSPDLVRIIKEYGYLFILLVIFSSHPRVVLAKDTLPGRLHHDLDLHLDPPGLKLVAKDRINRTEPRQDQLVLNLAEWAGELSITAAGKTLPFKRQGTQLLIEAGDAAVININWTLSSPPTPEPQSMRDHASSYVSPIRFDSKGAYFSAGSAWHPHQEGVSATYTTTIRLPTGFWAMTAGGMARKTTAPSGNLITFQADYPLKGLALAAGRWTFAEDINGSIPVYTFFGRENSALATTYLTAARRYLTLYEKLFGPYPFKKFAMVENEQPTGYGFPSWTLLGKGVIKLPFIVKTSLGHEIAHSWWGNGVWVDNRWGNWSEGLTTYVADYLYKERQGPDAAREYRMKILRDYAALVPVEAMPLVNFRSRYDKISQAIGYGKAAMLFHQIRLRIGDQAFWSALRHLAAERLFHRVDWMEILDYFSSAGHTPLRSGVTPWLERGDVPELRLTGVTRAREQRGWLITGFLQQSSPAYPLHVDVVIETESGVVKKTLQTPTGKTPFHFSIPDRPRQLRIDPDVNLMRRLSHNELPLTVNSLRSATPLHIYIDPQLNDVQEKSAKALLTGLKNNQNPTHKYISERDLSSDFPLLYIGSVDAIPEFMVPSGLRRLKSGATVFRKIELTPDTSLLHIWKNRQGTLRAVYLPAETKSSIAVARKIPHYGRYSSLLFVGLKNTMKETAEPDFSPLTFRWPIESK